MLKLYYTPGTCALATHLALEEAGADYTTERVDFKTNQQNSPEYLDINPKGRVPSLVTDRGTLTETPAMLSFIAQSFPNAKLAPLEDPFAFAQLQSFTSYLCSSVHVAHAHKGRGYRWASDESSFADMKRKIPESMAAAFALIEKKMLKGPWVMGETFTVCDPYLFTPTSRRCRRSPIMPSGWRSGRR
jgi:glutathione S-transferase